MPSFPHIRDIEALGPALGPEIVEGGTPMELAIGRPLEGPGIVADDLAGRPHEPSLLGWRHIACRYRPAVAPGAARDFVDIVRPCRNSQARNAQAKRNQECQCLAHWNLLRAPQSGGLPADRSLTVDGPWVSSDFHTNPSRRQHAQWDLLLRSGSIPSGARRTNLETRVKSAFAVKADAIRPAYNRRGHVSIRRRRCTSP